MPICDGKRKFITKQADLYSYKNETETNQIQRAGHESVVANTEFLMDQSARSPMYDSPLNLARTFRLRRDACPPTVIYNLQGHEAIDDTRREHCSN